MPHRVGSRAAAALMLLALWAATAVAQPAEKIDTLKRIRDTGAITRGVRETSVPFSFLDAQKQPQGYSVDLCLRAAEAIKTELKLSRLEVKYLPVSSANRIPASVDGKIRRVYAKWFNTKDLTVPLNQYLKEAFAARNTYPAWP